MASPSTNCPSQGLLAVGIYISSRRAPQLLTTKGLTLCVSHSSAPPPSGAHESGIGLFPRACSFHSHICSWGSWVAWSLPPTPDLPLVFTHRRRCFPTLPTSPLASPCCMAAARTRRLTNLSRTYSHVPGQHSLNSNLEGKKTKHSFKANINDRDLSKTIFFFLFSPFPFLARLDSLTVVYVSPAHPTPVCLGVCVAGMQACACL